jgi:hypothetical protein
MSGFNSWRFGAAMALTFSILYTLCALAVVLFPDSAVNFFNNWFHGLDLRLLKPPGGRLLTVVQFVYGLASAAAVSFVVGAVLAGSYNIFSRRTEGR